MLIVALGGVAGVCAGWARGGRLANLASLGLRAGWLLFLAVMIQVGAGLVPVRYRFGAIVVTYGLVGVWLVANVRWRGERGRGAIAVVAAGWLLNVVPILANEGMPVSLHGLERVGVPPTVSVSEGHFFKHVPADRDTAFAPLGDVIPVGPLRSVISLGDVVVLIGFALTIAAGMGATVTARGSAVVVVEPDDHILEVPAAEPPAPIWLHARNASLARPSPDRRGREADPPGRLLDVHVVVAGLHVGHDRLPPEPGRRTSH